MPADIEVNTSTTVDDDINLLSEGENDEQITVTKPPVVEEEEEETEEEDEEKPITDEDLLGNRPKIDDLKKAFPELMKKFPTLRGVIYREYEFSKVFPTVEDAKEARENDLAFVNIREDVMEGDGSKFLGALNDIDPKSVVRFASVFLPSLYKVSPDAHWYAITPLLENVARSMYNVGEKSNDDNLKNSALFLAEYLFKNHDIATGKANAPRADIDKIKAAEKTDDNPTDSIEARTRQDVLADGTKQLADMVEKTLKGDNNEANPINSLTDYLKGIASEKIFLKVMETMSKDPEYQAYINSLWAKAKRNGWNREDSAKIISTFLARAKKLLPSVRSKIVGEMIGGTKKIGESKLRTQQNRRVETGNSGRPSSGNRDKTPTNPSKIDWNKTSDLDVLNDNVTLK